MTVHVDRSVRLPETECFADAGERPAWRLTVSALQDSVARLVGANAVAYQAGYEAAYVGYHDLSRRCVTELRKPKLRLGSALSLVLAAGAGLLVAEVIDE